MAGSWGIGEDQERGNDKGDFRISGMVDWVTGGAIFIDVGTRGREGTGGPLLFL